MGLISWMQSKKQIFVLQQQVALIGATLEAIDLRLNNLKDQIASVRQRGYKSQKPAEDEAPTREQDLAEIMKAFGGQLPIEMTKNYKEGNN